jgi:hypothetical protein
MAEKTHWPFDSGRDKRGSEEAELNRKLESEKARAANRALFQQRLRNDRLLVGGRAHVKKTGLS